MAEVYIRKPTYADLDDLFADLRPADRVECEALGLPDWQRHFVLGVEQSDLAWSARCNGELLAVYGASRHSLTSTTGAPWLLGTPALDRHRKDLVRIVPPYLEVMLGHFRRLENWVHAGNHRSIRWLKRLGFTIHPAAPYGALGAMFHRFEMEA